MALELFFQFLDGAIDGFVRKIAAVKEPAPASRAARGGFWLKLKGVLGR